MREHLAEHRRRHAGRRARTSSGATSTRRCSSSPTGSSPTPSATPTSPSAAAAEREPDRRAAELREMARICRKVPRQPRRDLVGGAPQSALLRVGTRRLAEGGDSHSAGRFDQYMLPYLRARPRPGPITRSGPRSYSSASSSSGTRAESTARRGTALRGAARTTRSRSAASTRTGATATNELSYMFLEAHAHVHLNDPNLSRARAPRHAGRLPPARARGGPARRRAAASSSATRRSSPSLVGRLRRRARPRPQLRRHRLPGERLPTPTLAGRRHQRPTPTPAGSTSPSRSSWRSRTASTRSTACRSGRAPATLASFATMDSSSSAVRAQFEHAARMNARS